MIAELDFEEKRQLQFARGYIGLKLYDEAVDELIRLPQHLDNHPDVSSVWWEVHAERQDWEACVRTATALAVEYPDDVMGYILLASSIRNVKGYTPEDSYTILRSAAERFKNCGCLTLYYDLACFSSVLGNLDEARDWLNKTFTQAKGSEWEGFYERLARRDPDLQRLGPTEAPGTPDN